jgi:hypothetical protein
MGGGLRLRSVLIANVLIWLDVLYDEEDDMACWQALLLQMKQSGNCGFQFQQKQTDRQTQMTRRFRARISEARPEQQQGTP